MYRYTLYLLVFVLACCAGVAAVIVSGPRGIAIPVPEIPINTLPSTALTDKSIPENGFKCTDKLFSFMLAQVRRIERWGYEGNEEIDHYIHRRGITNCNEMFQIDGRPDIDSDGQHEFIVRTTIDFWGTARSDTRTWVVQKTKDGYRIILDAGFTMGIQREKKRTGNYLALTSSRHGGADEFYVASYRYRRGTYHVSKCESYRINDERVTEEKLNDCEVVR